MLVDLTVIIPAYREAEALELLLPVLNLRVGELTANYEILVIDTQNALDHTESVCRANSVVHIRRVGESYGDAVRTGIREAKGAYTLFMDADGSHNPSDIHRLWASRSEFELVVGSRYIEGGETENPRILIFMSYIVNVVFRFVFNLRCRDVSNSFRLYRTATLRDLKLQSNNFDLIPEALIRICKRYGPGAVLEVPIRFEQRKKGVSKRNLIAFAATYLKTIVRLRQMTREEQSYSDTRKEGFIQSSASSAKSSVSSPKSRTSSAKNGSQ